MVTCSSENEKITVVLLRGKNVVPPFNKTVSLTEISLHMTYLAPYRTTGLSFQDSPPPCHQCNDENFAVDVGVRQGCVVSPWLFNIFIDGCMREMKSKVENASAKLRLNGGVWSVVSCLFAVG